MRLLSLFVSALLTAFVVSCTDTQPTQPRETPSILTAPGMDIALEEPGKLHNDIVTAFFQEWPEDPARRSPEEFCAAFARAANRVLPDYGAPPIVTAADMGFFVRMTLGTWKQAGFDPGDPAADPSVIAHFLEEQGLISAEEQRFLARYIEVQRTPSLSRLAAVDAEGLAPRSENIRLFLDVAAASELLWASDIQGRTLNGAGTSWGTKTVDALGALAKLTPILRAMSSATASVLFEEFAGSAWDYFGSYPPEPPRTLP